MTIYTIGFGKKNAQQFFSALKREQIELLVDIRLNNKSQLAGFTKDGDIQYFLHEICGIDYVHSIDLAPTKELLTDYQHKVIDWNEYESVFCKLMEARGTYKYFLKNHAKYNRVCLLCSEPSPEQCHRRLVAEMIRQSTPNDVQVKHL